MSKFAKKETTAETKAVKITKVPAAIAKGGKTAQTPKLVAPKAPKAEKAAKVAKAPKEKAERQPKDDNRKIIVHTKENPKRESSAAHGRYALYLRKDVKTVNDFIAAGGTFGDIRYDEAKGFIELA